MNKIIDVFTGEVKSAGEKDQLVSNAIGSCIVVTAYLPGNYSAAMAHIMLPGKAPEKKHSDRLKYAENALEELLIQLNASKEQYSHIEICLIGGGNVLKREDDSICRNNISSVSEILRVNKLHVSAKSLGGTMRRAVRFDVGKAEVYYREDSSAEMLLWKSGRE